MGYLAVHDFDLRFLDSGSLESKRKQLKPLKAAITKRFGAAVSEVDDHDLWQRSRLLVVIVGPLASELEHRSAELRRFVQSRTEEASRCTYRLISLADIEI